mmetsp:Transcript_24663/g.71200  ORF Transcript_24663/g.71200 Transcript_24663/m.71200 type:complete len:347 (-) Transcript_24663:2654-3694(-)
MAAGPPAAPGAPPAALPSPAPLSPQPHVPLAASSIYGAPRPAHQQLQPHQHQPHQHQRQQQQHQQQQGSMSNGVSAEEQQTPQRPDRRSRDDGEEGGKTPGEASQRPSKRRLSRLDEYLQSRPCFQPYNPEEWPTAYGPAMCHPDSSMSPEERREHEHIMLRRPAMNVQSCPLTEEQQREVEEWKRKLDLPPVPLFSAPPAQPAAAAAAAAATGGAAGSIFQHSEPAAAETGAAASTAGVSSSTPGVSSSSGAGADTNASTAAVVSSSSAASASSQPAAASTGAATSGAAEASSANADAKLFVTGVFGAVPSTAVDPNENPFVSGFASGGGAQMAKSRRMRRGSKP